MKWILLISFFLIPYSQNLSAQYINTDTTFSEVKHFNENDWQKFSKDHEYGKTKSLQKTQHTQLSFPDWLKYFVWVLVIGLLTFLIYKLITVLSFPSNKKVKDNVLIPGIEEPDDHTFDDLQLDSKLSEAIRQNDYRKAIRYSYLLVIRELAKAKLIIAAKDKTNFEYLQELNAHPLAIQFSTISRSFEKSWYGEIIPSPLEYSSFENSYHDLRLQLSVNDNQK